MKNFKVGDKVIVITGKSKNHVGKILKIDRLKGRVLVEGANMITKAQKDNGMGEAGLVKKEGFINISNIMHVDPKTGKRTKIKFDKDKDGNKIRVSKKSNERIA